MNFPNATADDWNHARGILAKAARAAGYDHSTAEDLAQEAVFRILTIRWATQPESVGHAALIMRSAARRRGWAMFDRTSAAAAERRRRDEQADREGRPRPPRPIRDRSGSITPSPADMAEHAERLNVPVYRVHEANGIGPGALAEPGHTPSVYGSGPATPTPVTGSRLSRLETDPNHERTLAATHPASNPPQWRTGPDLDHYRDQLAEYYGRVPATPPAITGRTTRAAQIMAGLITPSFREAFTG